MKTQIWTTFFTLFIFFLFSCQPQSEELPKEDTAAANRAFVDSWFAAINSSNWKEEVKPFFNDEGFIELHSTFREAFPDYHATVLDVISEGNKVVTHFKVRASHQGEFPFDEFQGVEPSGKTAEWTEVMAFDVVDGKFGAYPGFFLIDYKSRMEQFGIKCFSQEVSEIE